MNTTDRPTELAAVPGSRFAADDARLCFLRGASMEQLATIFEESESQELGIKPIYFALIMDTRFRATNPEELRELIKIVMLERRGVNTARGG